MTVDHRGEQIKLHRALGAARPPENISQEAFDRDDRHLGRLARLRPDETADAQDLWDYVQDLRFTEIQGPLFVYILPFLLRAWRDDLRGIHDGYGGLIEHLYPALSDQHVFERYLTPKQTAAVSEFMRQTILDEIDDQRGLSFQGMRKRPYRWFGALTTYGMLLPDLGHLWTTWWSLATIGRAIATVQYISCLMYPENENPVFSPWTRNGGGGPPCLWDFEGHLYTHRWLEPNVAFLKEFLSATRVGDVLSRAVDRLVGHPEHENASLIQADFPLCTAILEARCEELPRRLEAIQQPGEFSWTK